ncbi:MAG: metal ABC transporter permease [Bacteroidetes Order II. Incertae sedis bacterium]|nr:metal ABC transporter permease [Bacteroidetes Order II. bacterium]
MSMEFEIIFTAAMVATACALVGTFMMLRKMTMLADAISHAVLPGIVLAFLLTGSRNILPMLIGAGLLGLLTTWLTELLRNRGRVNEDAAMGTVFTFLFAVGVILISLFSRQVDLDQDCVLYGEIAYVPLDVETYWGFTLPRAFWQTGGVLLFVLAFVGLGYKELKLCAFDPAYAASVGISTVFWHYALMSVVSLVTVSSFESVGAILVVALIVAPPATAFLLTDKLGWLLGIAIGIGSLSSVLGYYMAAYYNASIAGGITVVLGALFLLAFLFAPENGLFIRWRKDRKTPPNLVAEPSR